MKLIQINLDNLKKISLSTKQEKNVNNSLF